MTDDEKLAKLDEIESQAWFAPWAKWPSTGYAPNHDLEIIERCQRIRARLAKDTLLDERVKTPD